MLVCGVVACCCVLLWLYRAVLGVRVSFVSLWFLFFVLALKTSLCVHSKRSRVYFQNAPACAVKKPVSQGHGRFDGTHGSVLNVHTALFSSLSFLSQLFSFTFSSLSRLISLSFLSSLTSLHSISLFLLLSPLSLLVWNGTGTLSNKHIDREHPSDWLSLYTLLARVRRPWSIRCLASC